MFDLIEGELSEIDLLSDSENLKDTEGKKFKHLCYLFQSVYTLAIEPRRNLSNNPGCEWRLQY